MTSRRVVRAVTAIAGCGLVAAGCGAGGADTGTTGGAGGYATALKYSNCMRSHDVPNFPDPGPNGQLNIGPGERDLNPQAPAFQSAAHACAKYGPGGGGGPHALSAAQRRRLVAFSQCMRTHGVPNFPDPPATFPAPGLQTRIASGPGGVVPGSPAFKHAAEACGGNARRLGG
ncbi:MAG TPA: hypothetical protein VG371_16130 [Solirubrobacteraceae bacterium]|nr:hypothetical protein [Solirubrobacteraceae bacterium]